MYMCRSNITMQHKHNKRQLKKENYNEKNLRNAEGGTGLGGSRPPASCNLARYSGHWSAMHGCPNERQNKQRQWRHNDNVSAY